MNWYYARGDARMGPVGEEELEGLVASGTITQETLVWKEGMADWQPLSTVGISAPVEGDDMPLSLFGEHGVEVCAECGRTFPGNDMVAYESHWVCGDCKEVFFQRIREGGSVRGALNYAGFWIRFCARFLDGVIMGLVGGIQSVIQAALTGGFGFDPNREPTAADFVVIVVGSLISIALGIAYEVFFVGKYAATPGKMALGLKIIRSDGGQVSYGRATGRYFATVLSSMTLMIGYIIAGFDAEKRALHDHICDTRVVKK